VLKHADQCECGEPTVCYDCGGCAECCDCDEEDFTSGGFDADELGLDPEDEIEFERRRRG